MRYAWILCLWLLADPVCRAAEIVAWKVPLSAYLDGGLKAEGIRKAESVPEASPFFGENDELWDLKGVSGYDAPRIAVSPDWIIWNATTGRLIAKADWTGLSQIHMALDGDLRTLARGIITVELLEADITGRPPTDGAKLLGKVEFSTFTEMRTSGKWTGDGTSLDYDAETTFDSDGFLMTSKLTITARVPGHDEFKVATEILLRPGVPVWVARDTDGRKGLDLRVSSRTILPDGTPVEERCLIQKNGERTVLQKREHSEEEQAVENRGWISVLHLPADIFENDHFFGGKHQEEGDPSEMKKERKEPLFFEMASIKPPSFLHPWLAHEVLDMKILMRETMPFLKEEDLFGYDPIAGKLYLYSKDRESVGKMRSLFMSLGERVRTMVAITFEGNGTSRLLGRTASRPSMARRNEGKEETRMLEVEAFMNNGLIDLRLYYDDKIDPGKAIHVNNSAKLEIGVPQVLLSGASGSEAPSSLRVASEIISVDDE